MVNAMLFTKVFKLLILEFPTMVTSNRHYLGTHFIFKHLGKSFESVKSVIFGS